MKLLEEFVDGKSEGDQRYSRPHPRHQRPLVGEASAIVSKSCRCIHRGIVVCHLKPLHRMDCYCAPVFMSDLNVWNDLNGLNFSKSANPSCWCARVATATALRSRARDSSSRTCGSAPAN